MKITVDVDEVLLAKVRNITRADNESDAIDYALREVTTSESAKRYFSQEPPSDSQRVKECHSR